MSWLFGGSSSPAPVESTSTESHDSASDLSKELYNQPVLALDRLKHTGVPLNAQMTPYLQMDPSMFRASQPEYIMPEGNEHGKGKFEFALGHIGYGIAGGFAAGCLRGFVPELVNPDTRQLGGKPWVTRVVNATVKHGSGYAQPAGAAVFMYSVLEIGLKSARADDDLNSLAAGAMAGAIYRSPFGARASALGAGVGFLLATTWVLVNPDSRDRIRQMANFA